MKKILWIPIVFLLFTLLFTLPFLADADAKELVLDKAGLLSESEEAALTAQLQKIGQRHQMDLVVVITNNYRQYSLQAFADDEFDYGGYGYGPTRSGALLAISIETGEWHISTRGDAIDVITNDIINDGIGPKIRPMMSEGNFYKASTEFAALCDGYASGTLTLEYKFPLLEYVGISLVFGAIVGLIVAGSMAAQLKTVRTKTNARDYLKEGSLNITRSRDFFLYSTVSRISRPQNNGTHTSSSGARHGGGGGRF
jgi:uncharacterized protein